MNPEALRELLEAVARGDVAPRDAVERLRRYPLHRMEDATLDTQRHARCGFPEVIYGAGKTEAQILAIAGALAKAEEPILVTRIDAGVGARLREQFPEGRYAPVARVFTRAGRHPLPPALPVAVVCAGTSDLPVAEEAAETAEALGAPVERVRDVGVAGMHRLFEHLQLFYEAAAVVVVAGMEGALPSVIGGLTDRPVIAVPTSVGYGASFGGLAALLGMLNSCAAGVSVVNIDNGFSAGFQAGLIARLAARSASGQG
jgi:pyridinium-3,5-biscarboxylic acid mononucleotide synthase